MPKKEYTIEEIRKSYEAFSKQYDRSLHQLSETEEPFREKMDWSTYFADFRANKNDYKKLSAVNMGKELAKRDVYKVTAKQTKLFFYSDKEESARLREFYKDKYKAFEKDLRTGKIKELVTEDGTFIYQNVADIYSGAGKKYRELRKNGLSSKEASEWMRVNYWGYAEE